MKAELNILVLLRFCSTPITSENFFFLRMKTARGKIRVKVTRRMAGNEAYSRLVRNPRIKQFFSIKIFKIMPLSIKYLSLSLTHQLGIWKENHFEAQHGDPFLCHETKKNMNRKLTKSFCIV